MWKTADSDIPKLQFILICDEKRQKMKNKTICSCKTNSSVPLQIA